MAFTERGVGKSDQETPSTTTFGQLSVMDFFIWEHEERLYMKLYSDKRGVDYIGVDWQTGDFIQFNENEVIQPVSEVKLTSPDFDEDFLSQEPQQYEPNHRNQT